MADIIVATFSDSQSYRETVDLDGRPYVLEIQYNDRDDSWYANMFDQEENLLIGGVRLVLGEDLLESLVDDRLPPGSLFIIDTTLQLREASELDLGARIQLIYREAE